jgi:hypothetical protein
MSGSVRGAKEQSFVPTRQGRQRRRAEKVFPLTTAPSSEGGDDAIGRRLAQERFLNRQLVLLASRRHSRPCSPSLARTFKSASLNPVHLAPESRMTFPHGALDHRDKQPLTVK